MESTVQVQNLKSTFDRNFSYKDILVFLLLFFLNLKFVYITIIQDRNMAVDIMVYLLLVLAFDYSRLRNQFVNFLIILVPFTFIHFSEFKLNVLMPLLVIHAVGGIRFKNYLWMNFIIMGGTILIMYLFHGEGRDMAGYTWGMNRKERMNFGFNHPNVATLYYYCFIINLLLIFYFSRLKKWVPLYVLVTIPITWWIYKKTGARSFIFAVIVLYAAYAYYFLRNVVSKHYKAKYTTYILIAVPFIMIAVTAYFALNYQDYQVLNKLLSRRLYYYNRLLTEIDSMSFVFGTGLYRDIIIDSSYLHLLFEGGIIFFLFFIYFYIVSVLKIGKDNNWIFMVVLFSFLVYGMMETLLLYTMLVGTNIFWVMLYNYFLNDKPILGK